MSATPPPNACWTARDGATLTIRPIRGDDEAMEAAFVGGLSPATSTRRLLSGRRPQPDEIARWTHIDPQREMAFVAVAEGTGERDGEHDSARICGVVRYVREDAGTAAFAIVLADDWQGRGLGTTLMRILIAAARDAGIERLVDITSGTNTGMLALSRKLGFEVSRVPGDATVRRLSLALAPRVGP